MVKKPAAEQMDVQAVAERIGVKPSTVHEHLSRARRRRAAGDVSKSDLPEPDGYIGKSPWWFAPTIESWVLHRHGYGPRPKTGRDRRPPRT